MMLRELTVDELRAERGERIRACLCASWELDAVGRCVCPEASDGTTDVPPEPRAVARGRGANASAASPTSCAPSAPHRRAEGPAAAHGEDLTKGFSFAPRPEVAGRARVEASILARAGHERGPQEPARRPRAERPQMVGGLVPTGASGGVDVELGAEADDDDGLLEMMTTTLGSEGDLVEERDF